MNRMLKRYREKLREKDLREEELDALQQCAELLHRHMRVKLPYAFHLLGEAYVDLFIQRCDVCSAPLVRYDYAGWSAVNWFPDPEAEMHCDVCQQPFYPVANARPVRGRLTTEVKESRYELDGDPDELKRRAQEITEALRDLPGVESVEEI